MKKKDKVAIFGGTFDPIHYGHLMIAEQIRSNFYLDEIIFMPSTTPPYKKQVTNSNLRLKMLKAAIKNNDLFSISTWELDKKNFSYSYKLIDEYIPTIDAKEVFFVIGSDLLFNIINWYKGEYFLSNSKFIVVNRPGYNIELILNDDNFNSYINNIEVFNDFYFDISSTYIRNQIKAGLSTKYLIPESVKKIINKYNIYK
ncbi:nicotinate-nucleotide adenylyltransferase [Halanaerobium congolense]|jgi:nicotinate-nucleotide adenylyltransferase|uniref:Probable nicotinate-nucleotide adenylyltransferase n=1 Tax=Halanaerobium congolense TaxID=54121 RepID=A0A4R7DY07_9FIRM|nr:nicotinate-nucleotide adenylyltransferase [Halanaerobium congolense]TDS25801.1 nicotinate-nucleotide adenylyltransferase [Halanaerobium congolense]